MSMLARICPICEVRAVVRGAMLPPFVHLRHGQQQQRFASRMLQRSSRSRSSQASQPKQTSRMALSPRVNSSRPTARPDSRQPSRTSLSLRNASHRPQTTVRRNASPAHARPSRDARSGPKYQTKSERLSRKSSPDRAASNVSRQSGIQSTANPKYARSRPGTDNGPRRPPQSRQPSRMSLSPRVASVVRTHQSDLQRTRPIGAFGGMNQTHPGRRVLAERERAEFVKAKKEAKKRPEREFSRSSKAKKPKRREGDMRALKMQRALSTLPYSTRTQIKSSIQEIERFTDIPLSEGIHKALTEALHGLETVKPTPIQKLAIPAILRITETKGRKSNNTDPGKLQEFLLAAETGSGKTLAYLIPIVEATKKAEIREKEEAALKAAKDTNEQDRMFELEPPPLSSELDEGVGKPRAIVLLPTAELVEQVGGIFKRFSHVVKQRVAVISANYSAPVIRNRLFSESGVDIVISTPHLLQSIAETTPSILSRVTHLVIDEADSLFDRSFAPLTSNIVDRSSASLQSLILASATIPRSLDNFLRERFPNIARLTTPNLHAIPRRVVLSVVDIDTAPYNGNRDLACADTVWQIGRSASDDVYTGDTRRVLVFVNERTKAAQLASYLQSKGVDAAALSRDTADARAGDLLAAFTAPASERAMNDAVDPEKVRTTGNNRVLMNTKALVVTDIASRGIDTLAVRHVVLYDVPHTSIDFIHRLGRTGRMGRRGRGIVLAGKDDRKDVIREVREAMFRGTSLI